VIVVQHQVIGGIGGVVEREHLHDPPGRELVLGGQYPPEAAFRGFGIPDLLDQEVDPVSRLDVVVEVDVERQKPVRQFVLELGHVGDRPCGIPVGQY